MSVNPIGSFSSAHTTTTTQVSDNTAKLQLAHDQKKLADDTTARVSPDQLAADALAITNDQLALSKSTSASLDTFL